MKLKYYSGAQVTSIIEKLPSKEYLEMLNAFAKEPSADVVEVVACKDCKYREGSACDYSAVYVRPNGYCQWGERRENG